MTIILKPTITISNKAIYTFIAVVVLLGISGVVYAYSLDSSGTPSIMGHSTDEIEVMNDCRIDTWDAESHYGTRNCPAGYTLISGGCDSYTGAGNPGTEDLMDTYPIGNGWHCGTSHDDRYVRIKTYCCKFG